MKQYKKLVRDKIPEIINKDGYSCSVLKLTNDEDFANSLAVKLLEESIEYANNDDSVEELADLFTVFIYILSVKGVSFSDFLKIYSKKLEEKGGFDERYFLIETTEEE